MSKLTVALVSFSLGVVITLSLVGSRAFTFAQEPPKPMPVLAGGAGTPLVPPITQHFSNFGASVPGTAFGVDGVECVKCSFNGMTLRYGGGNFQFSDFKFSGPVRFELTGAAANTVIFMRFVKALAANQKELPQPELSRNAPIVEVIQVKDQITGSYGTPQ